MLGGSEEGHFHLLGSTADRVLRKATCPVWVVQNREPLAPGRMLAPVDLSETAAECLAAGLGVLHQVFGPGLPPLEGLLVLTAGDFEAAPGKTTAELEGSTRSPTSAHFLAGTWRRRGRRGGAHRRRARRDRGLRQRRGGLLVLGTHGRSGFERFLLGSVASDVAAKSRQDVLIVPPAAAHEATH